jgi:tripartite-type tricarboxylate transporter receptor subunit TctC
MVIASGPGGGYDTYARVLGRHMAKHIPGQPTMINQNMDGAGGVTAANWAYNIGAKDGTVIVAPYNTVLLEPLFGNKAAQYDTRKFEWIGSIGKQQQACFTWHTSKVTTIEDATKQEVIFAATGATSNSATTPRIINEMIGTKFKVISGYGSTEARLAVERGEAEGVCQSWGTLKTATPGWVQNKQINVLVQTGGSRQKDLPDVPLLAERVANPQDKAVLAFLNLPEDVGRPFAMPPGTPQHLVAALRKAFDVTMQDPAFLTEAEKVALEVDPVGGEMIQKLIAQAYDTPDALVKRAADLLSRQTR